MVPDAYEFSVVSLEDGYGWCLDIYWTQVAAYLVFIFTYTVNVYKDPPR